MGWYSEDYKEKNKGKGSDKERDDRIIDDVKPNISANPIKRERASGDEKGSKQESSSSEEDYFKDKIISANPIKRGNDDKRVRDSWREGSGERDSDSKRERSSSEEDYFKDNNKDKIISANPIKRESGSWREGSNVKRESGNVKQEVSSSEDLISSPKPHVYKKLHGDQDNNKDKKYHWDRDNNKFNRGSVIEGVREIINTRKSRKIERGIIIAIYIIVLSIIAYFILASFFPKYVPFAKDKYIISAEDSKINPLSSFYIEDKSVLGDKTEINEAIVWPIISPKKFNIVFKPKYNIDKNTTAEIGLILVLTNNSNIYLNDELIFPNLKDYKLVAETPQDYVYVRGEVLENMNINESRGNIDSVMKDNISLLQGGASGGWQVGTSGEGEDEAGDDEDLMFVSEDIYTDETSENYIYKNFLGASVWSTRKLEPINIKLDDYKQEWTLINTSFRGNLKLAVYVKDNLKINFTKQDLNWYLGQDEYTVNITDYSGKEVYSELFGDDGVKEKYSNIGRSKGDEQDFSVSIDNLKEGVYYVNFVKDNYNEAYDSTLKDIKVNSNKVLIVGDILPWNRFEFYLKGPKKIGFKYWWKGKGETLILTGIEKSNINFDLGIREQFYFNKTGDYFLRIDDGYLWIYSNIISPSKQSWFNLPLIQEQAFNSQDVIVIDKDIFDADYNELNYYKDININRQETKISLRALEPNSVNIEEIRLIV